MNTIKTINLIRCQKTESGEVKNEALLNFKMRDDVTFSDMDNVCDIFNNYLDNSNPNDYVYLLPSERLVLNIDLNQMTQEAKDKLVNELEATFTANQLGIVKNEPLKQGE